MSSNTYRPVNSITPYLPPEQQFPQDMKMLTEVLSKRERMTSDVLNVKENGQYEKRELTNGQQWFNISGSQETGGNLSSRQPNYAFRLTFDLVALNGGTPIPTGAMTLTLTSNTIPAAITITTAIIPLRGFGGATNATRFYFINHPLVYVDTNIWTNASQTITITNNSGSALTQAFWVFEYLKT